MTDRHANAIAELNRIARAELGPERKKRHRHVWTSRNKLQRGTTVTFHCAKAGCDKTKQQYFPTLEEQAATDERERGRL